VPVHIHEILSGRKKELVPRDPGKIGIYVCGVTVYDRCHIGHLRSVISFDAIVRYLGYAGYDVTYIRNYTDIDDKIIARADEIAQGPQGAWRRGERYRTFTEGEWALRDADDKRILDASDGSRHLALDVSEYFIREVQQDFEPFNMRTPDVEPKVSDHIPEIIELIEQIIANGVGYESDGDVYFDVPAYNEKTGAYGKLSGRDWSQLMEGARVAPGQGKRTGVDFALWKAAKPGEPAWDSPWGKGRPGWHIECSVMSHKYLGEGFDIHGGGKDLIFPHHENEIAQAEGGYGGEFARNWIHNGFVTVDGVKMSKSLGNFLSLADASRLALPEVWRFLVLSVHYKSPIDFSRTRINEEGVTVRGTVDIAAERLQYFYKTLERADQVLSGVDIDENEPLLQPHIAGKLGDLFKEAMDDDFNTALAISHMGEAAKALNELAAMRPKQLRKIGEASVMHTIRVLRDELRQTASVLGILEQEPAAFLAELRNFVLQSRNLEVSFIEERIAARHQAKAEKDFSTADAIRDELTALNIVIGDLPGQSSWDVKL